MAFNLPFFLAVETCHAFTGLARLGALTCKMTFSTTAIGVRSQLGGWFVSGKLTCGICCHGPGHRPGSDSHRC
ncbi:hypothetical protein BJX76DRAFT_342444 [Aspergillus varians]